MKKLKEVDFKILAGLMKNSKISDRKLASRIGVSQPTVTRRRAFLEKELSLDYTVIPDFSKLGIEIMALHFTHWIPEKYESISKMKEFQREVAEFISETPNMILTSSGQGFGMSRCGITLHKDYSDLVDYKRRVEERWGKYLSKFETFIISLKNDRVLRPLTLKYLADYIQSVNIP